MFTDNWYKAVGAMVSRSNATYKNLSGASKTAQASYCTNVVQIGNDVSNAQTATFRYLRKSFAVEGGVIIGTGTRAPSLDDYCLAGDLISVFEYTKVITITTDDEGVTFKAEFTINNTGENAFTIGEIGLIANLNSADKGETYKALVERTVLDSPVTVEPGGVGRVTYTIRFGYPT